MAIKTFTAGSVLTSADTNTYLANSGLVYVTHNSFSGITSAAPLNILGCFTDTYLNYMMKLTTTAGTANVEIQAQLLSGSTPATGTDYRIAGTGSTSGSAGSFDGRLNSTFFPLTFSPANGTTGAQIDFYQPKAAVRTIYTSDWLYDDSGVLISRRYGGQHNLANSYTGLRIYPGTGNITGTITIYGYRIG